MIDESWMIVRSERNVCGGCQQIVYQEQHKDKQAWKSLVRHLKVRSFRTGNILFKSIEQEEEKKEDIISPESTSFEHTPLR
jgi:hypothetical protein